MVEVWSGDAAPALVALWAGDGGQTSSSFPGLPMVDLSGAEEEMALSRAFSIFSPHKYVGTNQIGPYIGTRPAKEEF